MRKLIPLDAAGMADGYDMESLGTEPIVKIDEKESEIQLSLTFPALFFSDDSHEVNGKRIPFKQVDIDGVGYLVNGGKPLLPSFGSGSTQYIKDHFEIYHVVGDPTLEIWKDVPRLIRLRAFVRRYYLYLYFPVVPDGCVLTIWYNGKLLKRIHPSSTIVRLSLRDLNLPSVPWVKRIVHICTAAPGNRFSEMRVRV